MLSKKKFNDKTLLNALAELNFHFQNIPTKRNKLAVSRLKTKLMTKLSLDIPLYSMKDRSKQDIELEILVSFFYEEMKFKCLDLKQAKYSEFLNLDYVLKHKIGHDLILAALFSHLANEIDLVVEPLFFFGQFILRVDNDSDSPIFLNAQNGQLISARDIDLMSNAYEYIENISDTLLEPQGTAHLVSVYLTILKTAYIFEENLDCALQASNLLLAFNPDDPHLRRDRGMILTKLGCPHVAVEEFKYFVEKCPNDPMAEITKAQIQAILPFPIPIH